MVAPLPALAVITALVLDSASGLIMNNPTHKLLRDGDMDKIIASHGLDLSKVMQRKNRGIAEACYPQKKKHTCQFA